MIWMFIIALFSTLVIVRVSAHLFHDRKNFGTKQENSKTLTYLIRKNTGFDIHHIHLGALGLIVVLPLIYINGLNNIFIVLLGVFLSLITDQIIPVCNKRFCYFDKKRIVESVLLHMIITIAAITYFIF